MSAVEMPKSIITLKNVPGRLQEVWVEMEPELLMAHMEKGVGWVQTRQWIGGNWYAFIVEASNIVTIQEYR
jgi:hypothetical protein